MKWFLFVLYLSSPCADCLVQNGNVRYMPVLQRIQFIQIDVVAVSIEFGKWIGDAQIKSVALSLGLDNAVSVELQTDTSEKAVGFYHHQTDAFGPAVGSKWCQLVLWKICGDDQTELLEKLRL